MSTTDEAGYFLSDICRNAGVFFCPDGGGHDYSFDYRVPFDQGGTEWNGGL